jgi:hypothetical protein
VSHLIDLTEAQRVHLAVAEADTGRLTRLIRTARTTGLRVDQWLTAAALATGIADQVQQIADHSPDKYGREPWATSARLIRDTAARFELWAELTHSEQHPAGSDAAA